MSMTGASCWWTAVTNTRSGSVPAISASVSRHVSYASLRISHQSTDTNTIGFASVPPPNTKPIASSGSATVLAGAMPPPMHGCPMGIVTSAENVCRYQGGVGELAGCDGMRDSLA
jgi:hypothetical protein